MRDAASDRLIAAIDLTAGPTGVYAMSRARLLPRRADIVGWRGLEVAAERINVDAPAPGEPCVHRESLRPAALRDVNEHTLDTRLMKRRVFAVRHEVAQQSAAIDARPAITN